MTTAAPRLSKQVLGLPSLRRDRLPENPGLRDTLSAQGHEFQRYERILSQPLAHYEIRVTRHGIVYARLQG